MTGPPARVCAISPYVPSEIATHAGGAYFVRHALRMARRFSYTILVPDTDSNRRGYRDIPPDLDVHYFEPREVRDSRLSALARKLKFGLLPVEPGPMPGSESARMIAAADLVEIHWARSSLNLVPLVRSLGPSVPIVVLPHDIASQLISRRLNPTPWNKLRLSYSQWCERRLYNGCQLASVFSDKDRSLLRSIGVRCPVSILDPPLDVPDGDIDRTGARPTVLFMGAMYRTVNSNGAIWFIQNVWPAVIERVPDARFVVVGADPQPDLLRLASPTVEIVGWCSDLDPHFRNATVFVAPLHYGAGLKFKVPLAMLYGLPVVATTVGAEGIVDVSGPDVFGAVTDDPRETAAAVLRLLDDRDEARKIGDRAREWAIAEYSFDRRIEAQLERYAQMMDVREHRTGRRPEADALRPVCPPRP